MSDWVSATDPNTSRVYYYNKVSKVTQWEKPAGFGESNVGGSDPEAVAANWSKAVDNSTGRTYYYNKITKKTAWKAPPCMQEQPVASTASTTASATAASVNTNDDLEPGWFEGTDPRTGRVYWYNKKTKESCWVKPVAKVDKLPTPAEPVKVTEAKPVEKKPEEPRPVDRKPVQAALPPQPVAAAAPSEPEPRQQQSGNSRQQRPSTMKELGYSDDDEEEKRNKQQQAQPQVQTTPKTLTEVLNDSDDEETRAEQEAEQKVREQQEKGVLFLTNDEHDEEDKEGMSFKFAKHRKGFWNRILRTSNSVMDNDRILSWKKTEIKKALLKQNRELDQECIQAFKNIMSYMGDRSSSKGPIDHAKKLLRNLMVAPAGVRDEVYVQLCKQTNKNPKLESTVKGWELMRYFLSAFPPSTAVKTFLSNYIDKTLSADGVNVRVLDLAKACKEQLPHILKGQRKQIPSERELNALKNNALVDLDIALLNGEVKKLKVDSYTTVEEVAAQINASLNLIFTEPFGLFEVGSANVERLLGKEERILDVVASWENPPPDDESNMVGSKHVTAYKSQYSEFLFKAKLLLKLDVKEIVEDSEAINLYYIQAVKDIVTDRYPVKEKDITVLAALQLQATLGDYKPNVHTPGWLSKPETITKYLPVCVVTNDKKKVDHKLCAEWEDKITQKYRKFVGYTETDAKTNYLRLVQDWVFYGATFFQVEQRQFKDYPDNLYLGVTCEGVLLLHPEKRTVLEYYLYPDIVTWGHSDEKFILVVGNIVQQRKLIFKTGDGKTINLLVHEYVRFKVRSKATITVVSVPE